MKSLHGGSKRVLSILVYAGTLLVLSVALGALIDGWTTYSAFVTNLAFVLIAVPAALMLADRVHRLDIADTLAGGALSSRDSDLASALACYGPRPSASLLSPGIWITRVQSSWRSVGT